MRPFRDEAEYVALGRKLFQAVDPVFDAEFDVLVRNELLDLMSSPGKAPGGYNTLVPDIRLPFVFINAVGRQNDIRTLLHEGGHAFHSLLTRDEPVLGLARAPIEFCEVASMAMELFGLERFERVYGPETARRAAASYLGDRLRLFPWVATIDAFQHWVYTNPEHTREERSAQWIAIRDRFAPFLDWSGLEEARAHEWHQQAHVFRSPFYYIEYAIALIGALQVWSAFREDPAAAVERYRAALRLGGTRPLPELFATAGARFAMDAAVLREVSAAVRAALAEVTG
jgi:oligoendopeptidase F